MSEAHQIGRAELAVPVPGGVLVLASPAQFGRAAHPGGLGIDSADRLRLLLGHPDALRRLRTGWHDLGLPGLPGAMPAPALLDALVAAIQAHRLMAAFFPSPIDPLDRIGAATLPRGPAAAPTPTKSVRDMSYGERVEATLRRVPAHLTGPLKEAFLGLISPTSIAMTVGAFTALAVAQFFGYGEAADAVLAGIAYTIAGLSGLRALYDMVAATVQAARATNDAEIDAAAVRLASAFVVLGMAFLTIFITRAARKAAQARAAQSAEPAPSQGQTRNAASRRPAASSSRGPQDYSGRPVAPETAGSIRNVNAVGGDMNCVNCAVATDATLAGQPASALGGGPFRISVLEQQYGAKFGPPTSIDGITQTMSDAGSGSRGIVFGSRGNVVGHVFNVVNQGGTVRFLDGQTGTAANTSGFDAFQLLRTNK